MVEVMALLEQWRKMAYETQMSEQQSNYFWGNYFNLEKGIYEKLLADPDNTVTGTVKELSEKYDVDLISYADSSGGVNILGPKMAEQVVEDFTYEFLKKAEALVDDQTMILLCPKTTFALLGMEKAILEDRKLFGPMSYGEGCIEMIGKAKFAGQMCIKNIGYQLENAVFKEVRLK